MRMLDNCLTTSSRRLRTNCGVPSVGQGERSVGLGAMGLHTFLQDRMIPWGSELARAYNVMIAQHIRKKADAASLKLGAERGEAPDMEGTGERFSHKLAIAPNASSSIFLEISPSCEQWPANVFNHKTLTGSHMVRNPSLERLLEAKGINTKKRVEVDPQNDGSVQHLDFLTDLRSRSSSPPSRPISG
jgi:ribonucleoside-diphosphate reductase alpha chain